MVLDALGNRIRESLKKIAGAMFVDEKAIDELVKEIQRALLQADVNVKLVFELSKRIKERALNEKKGADERARIVNIVYEELAALLGDEKSEIVIGKKPFKIMLVGVYGSESDIERVNSILNIKAKQINVNGQFFIADSNCIVLCVFIRH